MAPVFRKAFAGFLFLGLWLALGGQGLVPCASAQTSDSSDPDQVYRIIILNGQSFDQAMHGKTWLESLNYSPIIVEQQTPTTYRVLYGYFPTQEIARQALAKIQSEGITATEIVQTAAGVQAPNANPGEPVTWSVYLQEFADEAQAQSFKSKVQDAGFSPVQVRNVNSFFQVYAGNGNSDDINRMYARLRDQGFTVNAVSKVVVAPADVPTPTPVPEGYPGIAQAAPAADNAVSAAIMQSAVWKSLSDEQKQQVLTSVQMQKEVRSGDAVAQQVVDIDKRLKNLDNQVKAVIKQIDDENTRREAALKKIKDKEDEAEHQIHAGRFQEAALIYREIVDLDKDNQYGALAYAQRRLEFVQRSLKGEDYEGQDEANQRRYEQLKKDAEPLSQSEDEKDLEEAIDLWTQIKTMDPARYGQEATGQISQLRSRSDKLAKQSEDTEAAAQQKQKYWFLGLAGGFAVLLLAIIIVSLRQHGRHKEIMSRMHEITAMRPMRELTGGGSTANLLGGPSATGSGDTNIFKPKTGSSGSGSSPDLLDPLGGLEPEPVKKKKGKGTEAPAAPPAAEPSAGGFDDVFGGIGGGAPATGGGTDFGFDDIFAAPTGQTGQVTAAPTAAGDLGGDATFGGLFGESSSAPKSAPDSPAAPPPQHEVGPISFDDLVAVPDEHHVASPAHTPAVPASPHDDLMAMFGSVGGGEGGNGQQPAAALAPGGLDHLADSPFANFMNDLPPSEIKPPPVEDDTEIPSVRLDMSDSNAGPGTSSFGQDSQAPAPESEATSTALDLPSFSFEDHTLIESVAQPAAAGASATAPAAQLLNTASSAFAGADLDFEEDPVGQPPMGWEGEYPFATLLVKSDTPPRSAHQYLAFEKKEGTGKALFSYRFPPISGVVTIEFDLRCNDKNKFLLGFYVEKDGDFQQSVHTKILRSEAQTTPTIHMQGESAPYLLGSWAHIKYVVDLKQGKLNGYIDSTHVARDLTLSPNPGSLNTLSIRDNINTTGMLLLDNIRISQGAA